MNSLTGVTMRGTGIAFAVFGVVLLFMPLEVAPSLGVDGSPEAFIQLLAAMYLGFAALNWTGRNAIYGGIYGRPIVLANFAHGFIGFMSVWDLGGDLSSRGVWGAWLGFYAIYAAAFIRLMYSSPFPATAKDP